MDKKVYPHPHDGRTVCLKPIRIDPKATARAEAFSLWMQAPNPMVTLFKTLDVTRSFGSAAGGD